MEKNEKTYVVKVLTKPEELQEVYNGSWYTICGCGGEHNEWVEGITKMLTMQEIGVPKKFYFFSGALVNEFAGNNNRDPFSSDLTLMAFSNEGLNVGKLAIFKVAMQDRWFDDIVDNMCRTYDNRRQEPEYEQEEGDYYNEDE